jgi:hypothetical protein
MNVAEKLNIVSENLPKIYNAGYEKGRNDNLSNKEGRIYVKNPVISEGISFVGSYAFHKCDIDSIVLSSTIEHLGTYCLFQTNITELDCSNCKDLVKIYNYACYECGELQTINLSNNNKLTEIGDCVFYGCTSLTSVQLPKGIVSIGTSAFTDCKQLENINLPNTITKVSWFPLSGCTSLEFVDMENGFNCNGFKLSNSTLYSVETIVSWGEALYDRTGLDSYTLTIGSENIEKLTNEQIAIFTNKNWNLA